VAIAAGLVALVPAPATFWAPLHGARRGTVIAGEDASGTFALRLEPGSHATRAVVFANGLGQGWIPFSTVHLALGALPAFIHPRPADGLVIGLGSGGTLFGMAGRRSLTRMTCVEIVRPQLVTLRRFNAQWFDPGVAAILTDPRVEHLYGDGRTFLARSGRRFDIIEADALRPSSSYSGNLYSTDYFELLRRHLKPGGLAVSWSPTSRTHDSFVKVFPHVLSFGHIVLGSNEPMAFDAAVVRARLRDAAVRDYYASAGSDIEALLAPFLTRAPQVFAPSFDRSSLVDVNTDLFPRDEFAGIARVAAEVVGIR
jgi:predicted membrane-bound spermidine synthase